MQISACFSGHRHRRFHFSFDESHNDCLKIKELLREWIEFLISKGVSTFFSGFCAGVDLWSVSIVMDLKKQHPHIQVHAVIPFKDQPKRWSSEQQNIYNDLLEQCDHVTILHDKFRRGCYFERNRFMVDNSDYLLAVFDGSNKGGTYYTTNYSRTKNKKIIVIHPDSLEVTATFDL
jgi:uncharacterized phage-like protein YoqJ